MESASPGRQTLMEQKKITVKFTPCYMVSIHANFVNKNNYGNKAERHALARLLFFLIAKNTK